MSADPNMTTDQTAAPSGAAAENVDATEQAVLLPVARLRPHEISLRVYGREEADTALAEGMRVTGQQEPIIVTRDNRVVSGSRRLGAAPLAGMTEIAAIVRDFPDETAVAEAVLEANRQRKKTNEQLIREFTEFKRLEEEKIQLARQRGGSGANLPTGKKVRATDTAAKKVGGYERRSFEKGSKVLAAIEELEAGGDTDTPANLRAALNKSIDSGFNMAAALGVVGPPRSSRRAAAEPSLLAAPEPVPDPETPESDEIDPETTAPAVSLLVRLNAIGDELAGLDATGLTPEERESLITAVARMAAVVAGWPKPTSVASTDDGAGIPDPKGAEEE